ncbi:hypothetical protein G9A89_001945 [Geosiphon pyriformis]|nr:hypothetical protein G9A89_001945 [Geosiphon pyriformis]
MRNTQWQPSSTVAHALLNALEGQNELENEIISHAWLVEKLFSTKKYGMTFLREEKHMTNCSNVWMVVHTMTMKYGEWHLPKLKECHQKK